MPDLDISDVNAGPTNSQIDAAVNHYNPLVPVYDADSGAIDYSGLDIESLVAICKWLKHVQAVTEGDPYISIDLDNELEAARLEYATRMAITGTTI